MNRRRILAAAWMILGTAVLAAAPVSDFQREHHVAAVLLRNADWAQAAAAYRAIGARGPDDPLAPNAQFGLARALAGAREYDEATGAFQAVPAILARQKRREVLPAWNYAIHREIGAILEAQDESGAAIESYRKAINAIGPSRELADERARARLDWARCLARLGKGEEAIKLLTDGLRELNRPEFAGMRALQKATLAQHYVEVGERDWAVTVLEEIRADPELDPQHYAAADALVKSEVWKPATKWKIRTRKGRDYLAIESGGRYELRMDSGRGWITDWYNLENDPYKTTNLAGLGSRPLLATELTVEGPGAEKWSEPKGNTVFEVLEESRVRVRVRTRSDRWPFETFEYTFYPTGQVFVAVGLEPAQKDSGLRIETVTFHVAKNARLNWRSVGEGGSRMSGEGKEAIETSFLLAHSSATPSFQRSMPDDLLVFPSSPRRRSSIVNEESPMSWRKASMRFSCAEQAGRHRLALQMRVYPRTIDSVDAAQPYFDDYRSPAMVKVRGGTVRRNDPGDLNGDGYNESEGCYVVEGSGHLTIFAGERARHQPVIKFLALDLDGIPDVMVNGRASPAGSCSLVRTGNSSFLLQFYSVLPAGERMELELD